MSLTVSFGADHEEEVCGLLRRAQIDHTWSLTDRSAGRMYVPGSDDAGRYLLRLLVRRQIRHRIVAVDGKELPHGTQHVDDDRFGGT